MTWLAISAHGFIDVCLSLYLMYMEGIHGTWPDNPSKNVFSRYLYSFFIAALTAFYSAPLSHGTTSQDTAATGFSAPVASKTLAAAIPTAAAFAMLLNRGQFALRIYSMSVAMCTCRGLGVETAKNLTLAGPGLVSLCDDELVAMPDLGGNFFLEEGDVGKPRAR